MRGVHIRPLEKQISKLKEIDNRGASNSFCGSLPAITSGVRGFENTCYIYENCKTDDCFPKKDDDFYTLYNEIKGKFGYLFFDHLPSQILYLLLVMSSSLIGTMYKLKDYSFCFIKTRHILIAFFQGFIAYAMSVGAEFVVVLGNHQVLTAVNPYSVSLIGCFAGMFFEKFFNSVLNQKNHSKKCKSPHPFTLP
jgi:hypothetical protein